MPGRRPFRAIVLVAAAWSVSCSTPPVAVPSATPPAPSAAAPTASAAASGDVVKRMNVCIAEPPPSWTAAFRSRSVTLPEGVRFGLGAPTLAGLVAYGQYSSANQSGIGALDLVSGHLTKISPYERGVSGMGWMAVETPWVVWEQANSPTDPGDWSVFAWNRDSSARITVTTSRLPDGTLAFGQPPFPAIRHGIVTWAQPLPRRADYNEAEIRAFDLVTGRSTAVASGRVSSPVFAGRYLVWGARTADGRYSLAAVDAETLGPIEVPTRLRDPSSIVYLAGSAKYLAWTSSDSLTATVWSVDSGELAEYRSPDLRHLLQFPQLADHYLLSYGGITSTVIDLATGAGFDVSGSLAGSDQVIAMEEPSSAPVTKGTTVASRVSSLAISAVSGITTCAPR